MSKNNDSTIYVDMGGVSEVFEGEEKFDKGVIDRGKQLQKHCIQLMLHLVNYDDIVNLPRSARTHIVR